MKFNPSLQFESVAILFSDIVSYTTISQAVPMLDIMSMVDELFMDYDAAADVNEVFKVQTIGA